MSLGGGGSDTSTSQVNVPEWYQAAQRGNISRATEIANRPYIPHPGPRQADWTGDQQDAFGMVRDQIGQSNDGYAAARDYIQQSASPVQADGYAAAMSGAPAPVQAEGYQAAQIGPASMTSAPTGAAGMSAYMDPFTDQVVGRAMDDINRAEDIELSQARRRAGANSAFGGSRTAIMENEIGRRFDDQRGDTAASLRSQGFNTAMAGGMADAERIAGANTFNANARNDLAVQQAGMDTSAAAYGAQAGNEMGVVNAGFEASANDRNADAINMARRFGSEIGLQGDIADRAHAMGAASGMMSATEGERGANISDTSRLFDIGERERGLRQQGLDTAVDDFERQRRHQMEGLGLMIGATSGVPTGMFGQTTVTPSNNQGSTLSGIGSLLAGGAAVAGMFSDRRLKQDIVPVGGGIYEFSYKWDPATRHRGVMSDEINPKYVIRGMSGFDMVDYGLMAMEA